MDDTVSVFHMLYVVYVQENVYRTNLKSRVFLILKKNNLKKRSFTSHFITQPKFNTQLPKIGTLSNRHQTFCSEMRTQENMPFAEDFLRLLIRHFEKNVKSGFFSKSEKRKNACS